MKRFSKLGTFLTVIGLLFWIGAGMTGAVFAADNDGSLTLLCKTTDGKVLTGMHWDIYYVGARETADTFALRGDFADFPVSLNDTSASGLAAAAQTLENFAILNQLSPLDSQEASDTGHLCFDTLERGLYLVSGVMMRLEDTYYIPTAFLVEIPEEGSTVDFSVHPKYLSVDATQDSWDYAVKKIWANTESQPEDHADFVTVQIYRNGVLVDTVELNDSNDWSYQWSATEFYDWRVLEIKVSEKYYVVYRSNETQYVIVNTYNNDYQNDVTHTTNGVETATTTSTTETVLTDENTTDSIGTGAETSNDTETILTETSAVTTTSTADLSQDTEKLPQTGQLWWPVPVFGLGGLLLIAIGMRLRTKE